MDYYHSNPIDVQIYINDLTYQKKIPLAHVSAIEKENGRLLHLVNLLSMTFYHCENIFNLSKLNSKLPTATVFMNSIIFSNKYCNLLLQYNKDVRIYGADA